MQGFSLIEMLIVIGILGLLVGLGIPAFRGITQTYELRGAADGLAAHMRLYRQRAIDIGRVQTTCFYNAASGQDYYHVHDGSSVGPLQKLPKDLSFNHTANTWQSITWGTDGRANPSTLVLLRNNRGLCDTISVQTSGMVLVQHR